MTRGNQREEARAKNQKKKEAAEKSKSNTGNVMARNMK
jgi:hypothetical protein